jgi:glycerol uptake facilitator-like aquaporin
MTSKTTEDFLSSTLNRPLMTNATSNPRRRASTCPAPKALRAVKTGGKKFKPSSVWAAPEPGTKAHKKAKKAKQADDAPLPPLSNHWTRFFLVEFMGNFVSTTLYSGCIITLFLNMNQVAWANLPVVALNAPFQQTLSFPTPTVYLAILIGLSYSLGLLVAPESKLNPVFTVAMAMFGLSTWRIVLPSVMGQLLGVMFSNFFVYFMAKDLNFWNTQDLQTASIFGVTYPSPVATGLKPFPIALDPSQPQPNLIIHGQVYKPAFPIDSNTTMYYVMTQVSNSAAFFSTAVFAAILVLVIIPLFTAQKLNHAANSFAFGLIVACLVASTSALGVASNPALWFGGAISCLCIGYAPTGEYGIFTSFDNYWWVGLVAPFVGAIMGGFFLELYGFAIFFEPDKWTLCASCSRNNSAKQDELRSQRASIDQQLRSKNPHERAAAYELSSDSGEEDSERDEFDVA